MEIPMEDEQDRPLTPEGPRPRFGDLVQARDGESVRLIVGTETDTVTFQERDNKTGVFELHATDWRTFSDWVRERAAIVVEHDVPTHYFSSTDRSWQVYP
jgi:hypothetical protein